ncbi:Gtpase era [Thalictrum thalictroides]|uniref:Gtpase era n=1 Tax=Thalictrum thalictroides TaxID=46969 RepID=A0A7J6W5P2_THATH|nr:Gtpase era [Thalictrum thalictroides]
MNALRAFRILKPLSSKPLNNTPILNNTTNYPTLYRFYSAQPQPQQDNSTTTDDESTVSSSSAAFDSNDYILPTIDSTPILKPTPTWDQSYRRKAERVIFGEDSEKIPNDDEDDEVDDKEEEKEQRSRMLAKALLQAALEKTDDAEEEHMIVKEEDQKSIHVGIIGAPNAGKSCLTNYMVGTKVAAVSRKTNTTTHEVLGVVTEGNTQICLFDTPGLMLKRNGYPYRSDAWMRAKSAWSSVNLYDVLLVIFDVYRHLTARDKRVVNLIANLGAEEHPTQKRVLCLNKVDLVQDKKDLLKVAKEFGNLPGYQRFFMISGLKGSGVKDLTQYLMEQAVRRPWEEDHVLMTEDVMKNISLEVVREKMLHHIHQEIPYVLDHRLVQWKELRDGSIRIEQHFITEKQSQRKILVGKNGSKIGRIGMEANEELRAIFKRDVHLMLVVRVS